MRIATSALLVSVMVVSSCAAVRDSRVNPFNWFGRSTSEPVRETQENTNPLIPQAQGIFARQRAREGVYSGTPVAQVTELVVEPVAGGAIIRVKGLNAKQGAYDVQLTPELESETPVDGVLSYRLEARQSQRITAVGPERTRTIVAARHVTNQTLQGVRTIRVAAQQNVRSTRRR